MQPSELSAACRCPACGRLACGCTAPPGVTIHAAFDPIYVGNVTGATHYDHSKGLNRMATSKPRHEVKCGGSRGLMARFGSFWHCMRCSADLLDARDH